MAYTKILVVRNHLWRCLDYSSNPLKTERFPDLKDALSYAQNEDKTEHQYFVTGLNCIPSNAYDAMLETRRIFEKDRSDRVKVLAYHVIQSFAPGEVSPQQAHEIGCEFARRALADRFEITVSTHLDKAHLHNHIVFNAVSFLDGKMYRDDYRGYYDGIRGVSDKICREHGLSIIDPQQKGKNYSEWQAEKQGKTTSRSIIRADIDRAILASTTERGFIKAMTEMGYEIKTRGKSGQPLRHPALKPPDADRFFRFYKLGEGYDLYQIKARILQNIQKRQPFQFESATQTRRYRVKNLSRQKPSGLQALYYRYCYELHILVKRPASVKRVSFLLRGDIAKLDRLDAETRLLGRERIDTIEDLTSYRSGTTDEIERLTVERRSLYNQCKGLVRKGDTASADVVREQTRQLTSQIRKLRKEVVLCDGIAQRSGAVKEKLERLKTQKIIERKELNQDELRKRRRGGTGRENVAGNR